MMRPQPFLRIAGKNSLIMRNIDSTFTRNVFCHASRVRSLNGIQG